MIQFHHTGLKLRIRETQLGDEIFDAFRKKWIKLTPEEWVRQTLLAHLVQVKNYPAALVAVEKGIHIGEKSRRFDAVVFGKTGKPWMLIECKAPSQSLGYSPISQLLAYQSTLLANYVLLTNGNNTRCWHVLDATVKELEDFPDFPL